LNKLYAIIDLETTGTFRDYDKIIEVAILISDGEKILDKFQSLVDPEAPLPLHITELTGINEKMLRDAPKFYEVAKKIVEMTEGKVLVAHNAHFDYSFLKKEFSNLGFRYQRKTLCTLRLSYKLLPELTSHSLAKVCHYLQIPLENQHRALNDAQATLEVLKNFLKQDNSKTEENIVLDEIALKVLPPKLPKKIFENLPEATGVYYFYNEEKRLLYIGKSKNIKKRVATHLNSMLQERKSMNFKNQIADIQYVLTGSELIALLLESEEIKIKKPLYNRSQRRSRSSYGIFQRNGRNGYIKFFVDKLKNQSKIPLRTVASPQTARNILYKLAKEKELCLKLCGLYESKGSCFDYQVKACKGACIEEESSENYNLRAKKVLKILQGNALRSFFIITKGRNNKEKSVVAVKKGKYLGFAYVAKNITIQSIEDAKPFLTAYLDNQDVKKILHTWIKQHPKTVFFCD